MFKSHTGPSQMKLKSAISLHMTPSKRLSLCHILNQKKESPETDQKYLFQIVIITDVHSLCIMRHIKHPSHYIKLSTLSIIHF